MIQFIARIASFVKIGQQKQSWKCQQPADDSRPKAIFKRGFVQDEIYAQASPENDRNDK